jgi:RNA polymerase sigma-70 factor (ECF subfamily)
MATEDDIELVRRALLRPPSRSEELIRRIKPAIHTEIAHLLMRMAPAHGRNARQELEDLVQEAYVALLDRDAKRLAGWDPSRGCTLDSYVRMVARTKALDLLRSRRRTPWQDEGVDAADLEEQTAPEGDHEAVVLARETLERVQARLHELLRPRDYAMFVSLVVEEAAVGDVAAAMGMTPAAVYQWSSRFRRNVLPRLVESIEGESRTPEPA